MAVGKVQDLWRFTGSLCHSPDLSKLTTDAFPHDGTALGLVGDFAFVIEPGHVDVGAEEFGGITVDFLRRAEGAVITGQLRNFDPDACAKVFPNTSLGAVTGKRIVKGRASGAGLKKPGSLASSDSMTLLLSPDAPDHTPGLLMYNCIPLVSEQFRLQSSPALEAGFAVAFRAVPDASGRIYDIGLLEDLKT